VLLGVLAIDLGLYAQHRLWHAVPFPLALSPESTIAISMSTAGTAIRHHPVETVITTTLELAVIIAVGVPPLAVVIGMFAHQHRLVIQPRQYRGAFRGGARAPLVVVTPDMHRIHHSIDFGESNRQLREHPAVVGPRFLDATNVSRCSARRRCPGARRGARDARFLAVEAVGLPFRPFAAHV
jgi:hypothetical protein